MKRLYVAIICAIMVAGCATAPIDPHQQTIASLDDPLYALSAAVDAVVDTLPADARDDTIIAAATAKDSSLKAPFAEYTIKAQIVAGFGVLLVCDKAARVAYMEDVTCTPRIDTCRPTGSPCEFFVDVGKVCATVRRSK